MFDRPGSMGNPLFAAGGELSGTGEAAFLAELQARAEAESKQLESDVKAARKSRRFSQVHSIDSSQVVHLAFSSVTGRTSMLLQCPLTPRLFHPRCTVSSRFLCVCVGEPGRLACYSGQAIFSCPHYKDLSEDLCYGISSCSSMMFLHSSLDGLDLTECCLTEVMPRQSH